MTFGEKLYELRKAHGLSQEALAEKLNTSRQAVSKWENNYGYPETEKIIIISKLFQTNLEALLDDDKKISSSNSQYAQETKHGFYVNRETANGFLLYYKRKFLFLAAAFGITLGCNAVSYLSTEHQFYDLYVAPMLMTISIMTALAIVIYIVLKQSPYRVLRKKEFVFADDVRIEIQEEFSKMKKILGAGIFLGVIVFGITQCTSGLYLDIHGNVTYSDIVFRMIFSMILTGISSFITFFCIGIYWSYSILLRNCELNENSSTFI